jgi:hypothetical protein
MTNHPLSRWSNVIVLMLNEAPTKDFRFSSALEPIAAPLVLFRSIWYRTITSSRGPGDEVE